MSYVERILYGVKNCEIQNGTFLFPDSVTEIGNYAFRGCDSLKEIVIPNGVTRIGDYAFRSCDSLKEIIIPDSVIEIGKYAFEGCASLKEIVIPKSVRKIDDGAFECCRSLESMEIKNPNTIIDELYPFFECKNIKTIKVGNVVHPVECINNFCMEILSRENAGSMEIIHARYFNAYKESYIVKEGELSAHGDSTREAMSNLAFKKMQQLDVSEHVAWIKVQGYVTPEDYRLTTGACPETLEAVKGYWGAERFTELMTS